jgi:hypothetical protein
MAANPSSMDTRTTRAGTGIGIAVAIIATVGALAFLAPRLREEMRDDIFSGPAAAGTAAPAVGDGHAWAPVPAAAGGPEALPGPRLAVAHTLEPVPAGSLAAGESEVSPPAAAHARPAARKVSHKRHAASHPTKARHEVQPAQPVLEKARYADEALPARPAYRAPLRAYRDRSAAQAARDGRAWRRAPREDPWDYRTWHEHRNTDAPGPSPLDHQPG